MVNRYIYLLITVTYLKSSEMYFLNDDLGTNLPDRFGDMIGENWQEKRMSENDYSDSCQDLDNFSNNDKDSPDFFDYKNGNAETEVNQEIEQEERLAKRENKFQNKFEEPLNDAGILNILSKLTNADREALDKFISEEIHTIDIDKRELLKRNFEQNFQLNKRSGSKIKCTGPSCEEYGSIPLIEERMSEKDFNYKPGKMSVKRKLKFKRSNPFHLTSHDNILQAKISLLKDNYKRNSELEKIEDTARSRSEKNRIGTRFHSKMLV